MDLLELQMNYCHVSHQVDMHAHKQGLQEKRAQDERLAVESKIPEMVAHVLRGHPLTWGNARISSTYNKITKESLIVELNESEAGLNILYAIDSGEAERAISLFRKSINMLAIDWVRESLINFDYQLPLEFSLTDAA